MAAPPGFAPPPGFGASGAGPGPSSIAQPNGNYNPDANMNGMEGDFFGQLSAEEIQKKARKWRNSQKKRFNEKRRRGGGAGVDMGKSVSAAFWY
jgi:pre-mRNA-processing factor 8